MNEEWSRQVSPILRIVTRLNDGYTREIVLAVRVENDQLFYMGISGNIISNRYPFFAYAEALIHDEWMSIS